MTNWLVTPLDPVVARDGRPFGANSGNRMRLTPWLYPTMAAGSYRTMRGKELGGFSSETVERLKAIEVAGPFPWREGSLYFPAPKDILLKNDGTWVAIRPEQYGKDEGTDLPVGLIPALTGHDEDENFKPAEMKPWWRADTMIHWLLHGEFAQPAGEGFLAAPDIDRRTHVAIEEATGASADRLLFQTSGYVFDEQTCLAIRTSDEGGSGGLHPFGGERRLAGWARTEGTDTWACPQEVTRELSAEKHLRMVLATPAIFTGGWKPGWLDDSMKGTIPGTGTEVRLVAACTDKWKPISGFSLDQSDGGKRWGEKPIRRMTPAGSVYFFEKLCNEKFEVDKSWLQSVSDVADGDSQATRDGFGLALWGRWKEGAKV